MIPYSYNMVDMGGIDLGEASGTVVEGLYNRLALARNACGDLILFNWKFVGIEISPSACSTIDAGTSIIINGMIEVTDEDVVTVHGIEPPPAPVEQLIVSANGTYTAVPPSSGFNPVIVDVEADPVPFLPYIKVYGRGTISVESKWALNYTFLALAINGEGSTYQNNLALSLNGQQVESTELYYSPYSVSGRERRNARLVKAEIRCEAGDSVSLTCTNYGSYTMIILIGVPKVNISEVASAITTVDVAAEGEYDSDSICLSGYAQCLSSNVTDDAFEYTAHDVVNSGFLGSNYGAGFIFWLQ